MIIPDYAPPAALMVPHAEWTILPLLEEIARLASRETGVLLLSAEPELTEEFVRLQDDPEYFSVITAPFDTPWIRDRSPIPVREETGVRWVLPCLPKGDRPRDDRLFVKICAKRTDPSPLILSQGNLVAGPQGVALSTSQILRENALKHPSELEPYRKLLGIDTWLIFEGFSLEQTGHADVHVRFLRSDLMATAWNANDLGDRQTIEHLEAQVRTFLPEIFILRLPVPAEGSAYASPLNWIQLGTTLLIPRYPTTPQKDLEEIKSLLEPQGFRIYFIASDTLEFGGSLHCLTASIYM